MYYILATLKKKFDTQEILSNSFEIQLKQKLVEKSSTILRRDFYNDKLLLGRKEN